MSNDPNPKATEAAIQYVRTLAMEGTTIVTWAKLHDLYLRERIPDANIEAVVFRLVGKGLLSPRKRKIRTDERGRQWPMIWQDVVSSWDILPAALDIPAPKPKRKPGPKALLSGDKATLYRVIADRLRDGAKPADIKAELRDAIGEYIKMTGKRSTADAIIKNAREAMRRKAKGTN